TLLQSGPSTLPAQKPGPDGNATLIKVIAVRLPRTILPPEDQRNDPPPALGHARPWNQRPGRTLARLARTSRARRVRGAGERHLATNGDLSSLPELPEPRPLPAGVPVSILAPRTDLSFLAGGGEMGELTRSMDWSTSPVGLPAGWPQSLKTAVS